MISRLPRLGMTALAKILLLVMAFSTQAWIPMTPSGPMLFSAASPPSQSFVSTAISCGSSCGYSAGTSATVGTLSATMSPAAPAFSGTWSIQTTGTVGGQTCDNSGFFSISGNNLNVSASGDAATHQVCYVATGTRVSNSPFADVVAVTGSSSQNYALSAPTTSANGNYGTGCSGGSCLTMDDHWTESSLSTSNFYPGLYVSGSYDNGPTCSLNTSAGFSGWSMAWDGAYSYYFDYPYGYSTNTVGTSQLFQAADGSLAFKIQPSSYFASGGSCGYAYYASAGITTVGTIPSAGGMLQFRAKFDSGLNAGVWPGMQCSATSNGYNTNTNYEWGYTGGAGVFYNLQISIDNSTVKTASIGGSNDFTNWHTYAVEYTGDSGTKEWNYYVDSYSTPFYTSSTGVTATGSNYNCAFYVQMVADTLVSGDSGHDFCSGWHSCPTSLTEGPYYMWISDIQLYKKPGT